jgi:hypothetical protein
MNAVEASELARYVRENFSWEALDLGVTEPTIVNWDSAPSLSLPREQMFEPYRSFRLLDAASVGSVVVISFAWGAPVEDDGQVYLLPLDVRDLTIDISDDAALYTWVSHRIEFTLGGPRESWESSRAIEIGEKLSVVRPWAPG